MRILYVSLLSVLMYMNLSNVTLASSEDKLSCEQLKSEINLLEGYIESRTIDYSEIPGWYFGIPGLMRFAEVIEPALLETDKVFGPELRMDVYEKTPQILYNAAFAMAYPTVMAALVPGDVARVSYFAVTKKIMEKRLVGLNERYGAGCEGVEFPESTE